MNTLLFLVYLTNANSAVFVPPPVMFFDMQSCQSAGQTMIHAIENQNETSGGNHVNVTFMCSPIQNGKPA